MNPFECTYGEFIFSFSYFTNFKFFLAQFQSQIRNGKVDDCVCVAARGLDGHLLLSVDFPRRIWRNRSQNWQFQVCRACPILSAWMGQTHTQNERIVFWWGLNLLNRKITLKRTIFSRMDCTNMWITSHTGSIWMFRRRHCLRISGFSIASKSSLSF